MFRTTDDRFPRWLDPATLAWAADYCEAMAIRIGRMPITGYVAADVCAKGLRAAAIHRRRRLSLCPIEPVTRTED